MRIPFHKLALLVCVVVLAACSGDDESPDIATGEAIGFECQTGSLKSTNALTGDMQYFRVSAVWNRAGAGYDSFMNNQLVERSGTGWVYSPVRYWPSYGLVSFFAYSPAISSGLKSFDINNSNNVVTIGYEMHGDSELQEDFLVAAALEKTDNPVQLQFEHALAAVEFWAKTSDTNTSYRINKITLKNLNGKATLTGMPSGGITAWAWNGTPVLADYEVYQKYAFEVSATYEELGGLMVLPQVIGSNFGIEITYNNTETVTHTLNAGFEFEMGKKYAFYLEMGNAFLSKSNAWSEKFSIDIRHF